MQEGVPLQGVLVTGNFFQGIGAQPVLGRTLTTADATAPGGAAVAVLSEFAWRSRYGADPAIVGKHIPLGRQQFEVVGVIRRGMELTGMQSAGVFAPLTMARAFEVPDPWSDPESAAVFVVGRLRHLDHVHDGPYSLEVFEESVPEPLPFARPFDETRQIGHDERGLIAPLHHPQVRHEGREMVGRDFGPSIGNT